jgi:hypothetical protein
VASFSRRGEAPHQGESLYFSYGSPNFTVRTSALESIERPAKEVLRSYRH